jgi:hypothetical protein
MREALKTLGFQCFFFLPALFQSSFF